VSALQLRFRPVAKGWVRVYTKTRMTDGTTILPYYFAQTLTGASTGSTQQTCASTAWGPVGNYGTVVPIAISVCQMGVVHETSTTEH